MVIKKLFLIILVIILLTPLVFAEGEKVLFSGTTEGGEIKVGNNSTAFVTIATGKVRVKYLDTIVIAAAGQCQQENGIKLCTTTVEAPYSATITLSAEVANLEITKTIKSQEYSIGQLITAIITIKNSGSREAENVQLKDDVSNLTIINPQGCSISDDGNYLIYGTATIPKGSGSTCQYTFKSFQDGEIRKIVEIKYFNGLADASSSISSLVRIIPFGFNFNSNLETEKLELNKENQVWFNFSLKSVKETSVRDLTIIFPNNLEIKDDKGNIIQSKKYTTAVLVQKNGNIYKIFNVSIIKPSQEYIHTSIDFTAEQLGSQTRDFKVLYNYEDPMITFRDLNFSRLESLNTIYLNNNNNFDIIDIQVKLSSAKLDLNPKEFNEKLLSAKNEIKLGEFNFKTSENKKLLPLFVDLTFKTKNNQTFKLTKSFNFYIDNAQNLTQSSEKKLTNQTQQIKINATKTQEQPKEIMKQLSFFCKYFGWLIESFCN